MIGCLWLSQATGEGKNEIKQDFAKEGATSQGQLVVLLPPRASLSGSWSKKTTFSGDFGRAHNPTHSLSPKWLLPKIFQEGMNIAFA